MAQSPFVEGTDVQWAWDSTSLGWFKECPYKYYLHMIEGWRYRGESVHLDFGIFYHQSLEAYDRAKAKGLPHEQCLHIAVRIAMEATWIDVKPWRLSKTLDLSDRNSVKCRENLIHSVVWYLEKFQHDTAELIIKNGMPALEQHFLVDIGERDGIPYALCGYLDKGVTFGGIAFTMDRKTTATTLGDNYYGRFDPDNQMSLYTVVARIIRKEPIQGVIVDACQVAVGFSRFGRSIVQKTSQQLEELIPDLDYWLALARYYAYHKYWPRNDKSCFLCSFNKICRKSPSVRRKFLESDYEHRPWNPLELR